LAIGAEQPDDVFDQELRRHPGGSESGEFTYCSESFTGFNEGSLSSSKTIDEIIETTRSGQDDPTSSAATPLLLSCPLRKGSTADDAGPLVCRWAPGRLDR